MIHQTMVVKVGGGCQRLCFWLEADGQRAEENTGDACVGTANLAFDFGPLKASTIWNDL